MFLVVHYFLSSVVGIWVLVLFFFIIYAYYKYFGGIQYLIYKKNKCTLLGIKSQRSLNIWWMLFYKHHFIFLIKKCFLPNINMTYYIRLHLLGIVMVKRIHIHLWISIFRFSFYLNWFFCSLYTGLGIPTCFKVIK